MNTNTALQQPAQASGCRARLRLSPLHYLIDGMNGIGSLLIFAMMLLICGDVASRSLLSQPIYGVAEFVSLSIVAIVFMQLASTLRHNRMARADIFLDSFIGLCPRLGRLLRALFSLGGLVACLIVLHATLPMFLNAWHDNDYVGVPGLFTLPTWPVRLVILVGSAATIIQYGLHIYGDVRGCMAPAKSLQEE
uniref:TRAP transporter small permease subunit n=1 Tax=Marinobacterium profundum TaxID=1714300 RepID=UPI000831B093|nr:TRAP transporter small permease [Marinobacterium profundum]